MKEQVTAKLLSEMQDNLPIVEGPSLSLRNNQGKECPIRCSEVAGDSETVFCRIA